MSVTETSCRSAVADGAKDPSLASLGSKGPFMLRNNYAIQFPHTELACCSQLKHSVDICCQKLVVVLPGRGSLPQCPVCLYFLDGGLIAREEHFRSWRGLWRLIDVGSS